ncbi:HTH-type transcriptional regulator / antitoxin MqsA [Pseudomonas sp. ok272]|uniref:type II toxin-antitoxin system MqsA family antitoxin n=1 Tax=unclassified Pseudomonas TaxID=196821 RepID=UPI0008AAB871|nr:MULTISPECIES: type II toxin-antitoxin system MqsA family antitoxin [unclassified Pseudomonas]SEM32118.1 HTH-type transcriptional regulator / antitoxin MqsA [Pseudomonas sp. ok272]SFM32059.1 HTH-type transcriptional regulator / antitoxin MqsA [Pseudomonas sp. ok602]
MNTQPCVSCGTREGMHPFKGRSLSVNYKQMSRPVHDLAGWECTVCGEIEFDPATDSAERYVDQGDKLLDDCLQLMGSEVQRIRRKLHLTQKTAVKLLSGGGHNAFSRYERGELPPPQPLFTLMRLLDRHPHLLADVQSLSAGDDLKQLLATRHPEHQTTPSR